MSSLTNSLVKKQKKSGKSLETLTVNSTSISISKDMFKTMGNLVLMSFIAEKQGELYLCPHPEGYSLQLTNTRAYLIFNGNKKKPIKGNYSYVEMVEEDGFKFYKFVIK